MPLEIDCPPVGFDTHPHVLRPRVRLLNCTGRTKKSPPRPLDPEGLVSVNEICGSQTRGALVAFWLSMIRILGG